MSVSVRQYRRHACPGCLKHPRLAVKIGLVRVRPGVYRICPFCGGEGSFLLPVDKTPVTIDLKE